MTSDADSRPTDPPLAFQVMNEIGIINQLATTQLERVLPGDMKAAHFKVLNHFVRLGGARTPQELASAFQVTKGTMTNTIQKLAAREFIRIEPHASDGRSKLVTLTEKGRAAHGAAIVAVGTSLAVLEADIPAEHMEALLPLLRQVRVVLDNDPRRNAVRD